MSAHELILRRLGIDTSHEAVIYMRRDCPVCRSEGFSAHARVRVNCNGSSAIATVNFVTGDLLQPGEASLSEEAWVRFGAADGMRVELHHAPLLDSLSDLRAKIYGKRLTEKGAAGIVRDIARGLYSDIDLAAFITACAGNALDRAEMKAMTKAMVGAGERIDWGRTPIVDKHCIGGLPGNRTTPIVVAIAAAAGLTMPKTSSRAITSPAGTADTMETLAPVDLDIAAIRRVVEREGGCIVWGGAVKLSPADDILIRVERALDVDSEGQLVASVLSKKAAAGSTHLVLDLPTGPTAKIRTLEAASVLSGDLLYVAEALGIKTRALITDGSQPVGRGIGPALEARDILAVLGNEPEAPTDLRERSLKLAAAVLELAGVASADDAFSQASRILASGAALKKFIAICEAQGGLRTPPVAHVRHDVIAGRDGIVRAIDNRKLARVAKLAGAPAAPAAGVDLHAPVGSRLRVGDPLYTIHAGSRGELHYAREFAEAHAPVIELETI